MLKAAITVCFLIIGITGCTSQKHDEVDLLTTFVGKPIDVAREELGKPASVYDMQDGTFQYVWKKRTGGGSSSGFMGVQVASSNPRTCNTVLITNRSKTVVAFRHEGKC